jgi:hypothetical protein
VFKENIVFAALFDPIHQGIGQPDSFIKIGRRHVERDDSYAETDRPIVFLHSQGKIYSELVEHGLCA